jgi:hypothetical protein
LISKKSSPLKLLSQISRNLVGIIYGRSSIKIAQFVPIHLQTWPPQAILVSDKKNQPIQKQELSMATMFVNGLGRNEQTL